MKTTLCDAIYRHRLREPVPARVGAADRVGLQHHAGVRSRLGRGRRQDDRACTRSSTSRVRRPSSSAPTPTAIASRWRSGRRGAALVVELGAHLRQADGLVAAAAAAHQAGLPAQGAGGVDHGGIGRREGTEPLARADARLPGAGGRRVRAEPVVPAHGPRRHGVEHRQERPVDRQRRPRREERGDQAGLGEADADDDQHRQGSGSGVQCRRRRDLVVEHVHLAAADRSRVARVRGATSRARCRTAALADPPSCRCRWPRWRR